MKLDTTSLNDKVSSKEIINALGVLIKKNPLNFIYSLFILIASSLAAVMVAINTGVQYGYMSSFILLFVLLVSLTLSTTLLTFRGEIYAIISRNRLEKFAKSNNYKFIKNQKADSYKGIIFKKGNTNNITEAIIFNDHYETEIGNFTYTLESGNSKKVVYGYVKINIDKNLPNFILDYKKNDIFRMFSNLQADLKYDQLLKLEGNFSDKYRLYVPRDYKNDVYYLFTPDVMTTVIDELSGFDIEIVEDEIYLYSTKEFNFLSAKDITNTLNATHMFLEKFIKQKKYYKNSLLDINKNSQYIKTNNIPRASLYIISCIFLLIIANKADMIENFNTYFQYLLIAIVAMGILVIYKFKR